MLPETSKRPPVGVAKTKIVQLEASVVVGEITTMFIAEFEKYPCLYNMTLKKYHDRNLKKSLESISNKIEFSG